MLSSVVYVLYPLKKAIYLFLNQVLVLTRINPLLLN